MTASERGEADASESGPEVRDGEELLGEDAMSEDREERTENTSPKRTVSPRSPFPHRRPSEL